MLYDLSLTCHRQDGLYNRFWKGYDAFLRHSNYYVDVNLKLPEPEILKLKTFQTVFIDNQPMLTEYIKFKQNRRDSVSDSRFRTARLYQPYDLETEQSIETYHPQKYYWRAMFVYSIDIEGWLINNGIPYTIEDIPGTDGSNRQSFVFLPPSETEYLNQQTHISVFNYIVRFRSNGLKRVPVTLTITYTPTLIV